MRQSQLFGKTVRLAPKDETSVNAKLLIRAGFISKEVSGVYNFLPLGQRVLDKIIKIVREEMNAVDGQELLLSALQNKENWVKTGRWKSFDALFKVKSQFEHEYALGPTHEEVLVPIAKNLISSYRDLPKAVYQIQTKFRDEPRAKAGLLRGREFLMKDLYSFHATEKDLLKYYEKMKGAYKMIFQRCGLEAIETKAGGGTFSESSHEYQVVTPDGEDEIIYCPAGDFAENTEITKVAEGKLCDLGHGRLKRAKTIEVGNIFPLKTKFSAAFGLTYKDKNGAEKLVQMGCYGLGITRTMGAIVEVHHDGAGIIWPKQVAPFQCHLLVIGSEFKVRRRAEEVYQKLEKAGVEVLYDDREDITAGEKFADYDLIGIPVRLVVSEKTLRQRLGQAPKGKVEYKERDKKEIKIVSISGVVKRIGD